MNRIVGGCPKGRNLAMLCQQLNGKLGKLRSLADCDCFGRITWVVANPKTAFSWQVVYFAQYKLLVDIQPARIRPDVVVVSIDYVSKAILSAVHDDGTR